MACVLTQGYNLDCRDSYGGVKEIYIAEKSSITAITASAGVITAIDKTGTKVFFKYNLVAHTAEADQEMTASRENGTLMVKQTVKFPINKMTVAVRNELLLLAQNRLAIVVVDNNGIGWLFGEENGMMITTTTAKAGRLLGDRNGFELTFESDEKVYAQEVNAATLLTLTVAETP
jgi:hypothetical protein